MGKKFIIKDGKQTEISDESALAEVMRKANSTTPISFGQVVEYTVGEEKRIGKITGADKEGNIKIAKVSNHSRAGFQFSCTESDIVPKENIVRRLP